MQNSTISWTDHTFNLVWGCQKVSPGCTNCYAETLAKRYGFDVWGPAKTTARRTMSANYWRQPLRWNEAARKAEKRARVFCCSMADVFEDHPTNAQERPRLWELIKQTPWLDWLLLTKRPENFRAFLPSGFRVEPWPNVWLGTSVENQEYAEKRIPYLLDVPAKVRFLSCEPLLGPVELWRFDEEDQALRGIGIIRSGGMTPSTPDSLPERYDDSYAGIDWIIAGGESGHGARPMHPDWARSLRDQAQTAGVAFHFKQWGEYTPYRPNEKSLPSARIGARYLYRAGKHAAGRLLDGRTWDELPQ